jgi:hypothetical protein
MAIMFTLTKEIVLYREDIKKLLKKLLLKFHLKSEEESVKLQSKLPEQLAILMQELLNSSLILKPISSTLWK